MRRHRPLGSLSRALAAAAAMAGCAIPATSSTPATSVDASIETSTATTEVDLVFQQWTDTDQLMSIDVNPDWEPVEVAESAGTWFVGPPTGGPQPLLSIQSFPDEGLSFDSPADLAAIEAELAEEFVLIRSGKVEAPEGQELHFIESTRVIGGELWHHRTVYAVGTSTIVRATFITPDEYWDDLAPEVLPYLETVRNLS